MGCLAYGLDACSADPMIEDGQRAAEAVAMASEIVGLAQAFAPSLEGVTTNAMAAERAAAVAQAAFLPAGCARVQIRDNAVRVSFDSECEGPYGTRYLSGSLVATVALRSAQVEVALSGEARTRHSTLRPAVNVTMFPAGGAIQADYAGNFTGVGARGTAVSFDGRGSASLGVDCVQLNGTAAVTAGSEPWTVIIAGYTRCLGGCPMSGGSLLVSRAAGTQTRVELGGGANVSVTAGTGRAEAATVPCGG
ncbi:MAG: hypothetical protein JWM10_1640 [Myxococcaceae bacterium]|nr:hypothetical protein [Myxococcaceae bacterium]